MRALAGRDGAPVDSREGPGEVRARRECDTFADRGRSLSLAGSVLEITLVSMTGRFRTGQMIVNLYRWQAPPSASNIGFYRWQASLSAKIVGLYPFRPRQIMRVSVDCRFDPRHI